MIKYVHRFIITIFVVLVTTFASHANSEKCLRALATDLVDNIERNVDLENDSIVISSDGLVEFFTKNIDICRDYLLARKSPDEDIILDDPDLIIDISWDYLRTEVAAALTTIGDARQLFVCENHRSLQAGIDATLWAVTIVSAIFSGGTGAVVVQGAKVAVKEGIKGITKIGVKKGGKKAIKTAVVDATAERLGFDVAGKKAAKEAAETMAKKTAKEAAEEAAKKVANNPTVIKAKAATGAADDAALKKAIQDGLVKGTYTDDAARTALELIDDKIAKEAAEGTAKTALRKAARALTNEQALASTALKSALKTFAISTPLALAGGFASVYSFVESGFDTKVMNCTNTDHGEGCYTSCNKDSLTAPTDDLNTKVFKPVFGKNLCIDEKNNFVLREIKGAGIPTPGDIFMTTNDKWAQAKQKISSEIQNKGACDWNEDDIDMYVGAPLYDPTTLKPSGNGATGLLIDGIRIDD